jgi:hypothetical protein
MKSILLGLCAAITLAVSAAPAAAGPLNHDPHFLHPYFRYGSAWRYYPYVNGGHIYGPRPWLWNR